MKHLVTLLFCLIFGLSGFAQSKAKENPTALPMVWTNAGGFLPGGDLKESFGANATVGLSYMQKLKSNFIIGLDVNAIFGDSIYNHQNLFQPVAESKDHFITGDGTLANIRLWERGLRIDLKFGKLFPIIGPNVNSGLLLLGGVGFINHKVRIEVINNNVPSLDKEGKKLYDRYTDGLSLSQFIGYLHLSDSKRTNFYFGFELVEGFTKNRRSYNMYAQGTDDTKRLDLMYGFRAGWILPIYSRKSQTYYFD
jgi:hypothetical protein